MAVFECSGNQSHSTGLSFGEYGVPFGHKLVIKRLSVHRRMSIAAFATRDPIATLRALLRKN